MQLLLPLIHRIKRERRIEVSIYNNHYPQRLRNRSILLVVNDENNAKVYACLPILFVDIDLLAMTETLESTRVLLALSPSTWAALSYLSSRSLDVDSLVIPISLPLWQRHSPGARTRNAQRASKFRAHVHPKLRVKDYARQGISSENIPRGTPHRNSCSGYPVLRIFR
jgi:hypothetical protein